MIQLGDHIAMCRGTPIERITCVPLLGLSEAPLLLVPEVAAVILLEAALQSLTFEWQVYSQ